jgi:GTP-binding protein HflX
VAEWPDSVAISAAKGEGIPDLIHAIEKKAKSLLTSIKALVPYALSGMVQDCYDYGRVLKTEYRDDGIYLEAELVGEMAGKLAKYSVE